VLDVVLQGVMKSVEVTSAAKVGWGFIDHGDGEVKLTKDDLESELDIAKEKSLALMDGMLTVNVRREGIDGLNVLAVGPAGAL
jgi:hypothetical protein